MGSTAPSPTRSRSLRVRRFVFVLTILLVVASIGTTGWIAWRFRVLPFAAPHTDTLPRATIVDGRAVVRLPLAVLLGEVGRSTDELTAYLRFSYLQGLAPLSGVEVLMTTREVGNQPVYLLYLVLPNDLLASGNRLAALQAQGYIERFRLLPVAPQQLPDWRQQTLLFNAAYHQPVRRRLLQLPPAALRSAVASFILFKARTDRRIRQRLPDVDVLTPEQSRDFAADMIDVARFYDIPLDMLLGVGAMENNYLDMRGDLRHAVWKRRAQPGDIILRRRHGRVLVSNYSIGPWQITRETLRYVHTLYLHDRRDYAKLPPRLRPPRRLDLQHVDPHTLTTYAGLLLRTLLDAFHGDVDKAVGAYNGGPGRPNPAYAQGVSLVASYAKRVVSLAAGRKGNDVQQAHLKLDTTPVPKEPATP